MFGAHLNGALLTALALTAVMLGTINVFGGFAVTERMLQMFKKKERLRSDDARTVSRSSQIFFYAATLVAVVLFILRAQTPEFARRRRAAETDTPTAGMLLASTASIWETNAIGWWLI